MQRSVPPLTPLCWLLLFTVKLSAVFAAAAAQLLKQPELRLGGKDQRERIIIARAGASKSARLNLSQLPVAAAAALAGQRDEKGQTGEKYACACKLFAGAREDKLLLCSTRSRHSLSSPSLSRFGFS